MFLSELNRSLCAENKNVSKEPPPPMYFIHLPSLIIFQKKVLFFHVVLIVLNALGDQYLCFRVLMTHSLLNHIVLSWGTNFLN